jgi:hypothetical protein
LEVAVPSLRYNSGICLEGLTKVAKKREPRQQRPWLILGLSISSVPLLLTLPVSSPFEDHSHYRKHKKKGTKEEGTVILPVL